MTTEPTRPIYRIADKQPVFPCWLWHQFGESWVYKEVEPAWWNEQGRRISFAHWSPDAPTPPDERPQESQSETAGWIGVIQKMGVESRGEPASGAQANAETPTPEMDFAWQTTPKAAYLKGCELERRLAAAQAELEQIETHLKANYKRLPAGVLAAVKEVTFRVAMVEVGRDRLREERDSLRAEVERLKSERDDLQTTANVLERDCDEYRAKLAAAKRDTQRLDWLLNNTSPVKEHTGGWPYPDTRGTFGPRFVGRVYYEGCEGRPVDEYFKDRSAIDAAQSAQSAKEGQP